MDEGENGPVEVAVTGHLTPQLTGEQTALMLETDPSLLSVDTLTELERLVAGIRAGGGHAALQGAEGVPPHETGAPEKREPAEG
ncbi:hypothetical protein ACWF9B_25890 [Streptomyces sp. NPDC055089]